MIRFFCDVCLQPTTLIGPGEFENFKLKYHERDERNGHSIKHIDAGEYRLCLCKECELAVINALESRKNHAN